MEHTQIIILAAGQGTRMNNNSLPKVLVPLNQKPIIDHVIGAITKAGYPHQPCIVVGHQANRVKNHLGEKFTYAYQTKQLGTGHAVACAQNAVDKQKKYILILYGDKPCISPKTIKTIISHHAKTKATLTMATITVPHFRGWRKNYYDLGRIVRDEQGNINKIIEVKDASAQEKKIKELNPTYLCFNASWLWGNIPALQNNNAQKEYYLTDLIHRACQQGVKITSIAAEPIEGLGVNNQIQLRLAETLIAAG